MEIPEKTQVSAHSNLDIFRDEVGRGRTNASAATCIVAFLDLRAGGDAAEVCHGQPQILVGVHRRIVDSDFVVQMRPGRASA